MRSDRRIRWRAFLRSLRPDALCILFVAVAIAAQLFMFLPVVRLEEAGLDIVSVDVGLYSASRTSGGIRYSVDWLLLALDLAVVYAGSLALSRLVSHRTRIRRKFLWFVLVAAGTVGAAFVSAILVSYSYCGYFFDRPPVLPEAKQIERVRSIAPVETVETADGKELQPAQARSVSEIVEGCRQDSYYCLEGRIVTFLHGKGLLTGADSQSRGEDLGLYRRVTGLLVRPEAGYDHSDLLTGYVVDALDVRGSRMVFVSLRGREVSNDHYPFYEAVFRGEDLRLANSQRFFFDVAGLEGLTWSGLWLAFSILGLAVTLPGFAMVAALLHRGSDIPSQTA